MRYGAMNSPLRPLLPEIDAIAELGFDFLELAMDPPRAHYSSVRRQQAAIRNALNRHSLGLICHLPTFVYTADLTESIREASVKEMLGSLETAAELGPDKIVLHPSIITGLGALVMETSMGYAYQCLETLVARADQLGLGICLENMFPKLQPFCEADIFEEVFARFPALKLTLDTGHAHIGSPNEKRILEFIRRLGARIGHLHISDNLGKRDDHLPIGAGTINFRNILPALKQTGYDDTVTLEIFTDDRNDLKTSKEKFSELLTADLP
jgi:sugar phosphate isomerase/epimerase